MLTFECLSVRFSAVPPRALAAANASFNFLQMRLHHFITVRVKMSDDNDSKSADNDAVPATMEYDATLISQGLSEADELAKYILPICSTMVYC